MSKKHLKLIIIIIAVIVVGLGAYTLGRYAVKEYHDYYLNSKNFYFSSNRLTEKEPLYQINNWSGIGSFDISFDLLSMKNNLVYTDYDISYKVWFECPNDVICSTSDEEGIIYSSSVNHSSTVTINVNPQREYNEEESMIIKVYASSTSPYVKTISAQFEYIVGKKGLTYEIDDETNRAYLVFKVTNANNSCTVVEAFDTYNKGDVIDNKAYRKLSDENKNKCISQYITLTFDNNDVFFDNTSSVLKRAEYSTTDYNGVQYINSVRIPIEPLSSNAFRFFKKDTSKNYTYPFTNDTSIITLTSEDPM
jgi:hypothetical protein